MLETGQATPPLSRPAAGLQRWLPVVALLALAAAGYALGLQRFLTLAALAEHRDALKHWVDSGGGRLHYRLRRR
jgi:hypothetical protein